VADVFRRNRRFQRRGGGVRERRSRYNGRLTSCRGIKRLDSMMLFFKLLE